MNSHFYCLSTPRGYEILNLNNLQSAVIKEKDIRMAKKVLSSGDISLAPSEMQNIFARLLQPVMPDDLQCKTEIEQFNPVIILNYECNYRCSYCYEDTYRRNHTHNKQDKIRPEHIPLIEKFNDQYAAFWGIPKVYGGISVMGGEPFLPQNKEIIYALHEHWKNTPFYYTTNGTYLMEYSELLQKSDVKLKISLDGTKEVHLKRRKTSDPGYYDRTIEGLAWAARKGIEITVMTVFYPENLSDYPRFFDMLEEIGWLKLDNIKLLFMLEFSSGCDDVDRDLIIAANHALQRLREIDQRTFHVSAIKFVPGASAFAAGFRERSAGGKIPVYRCGALNSPVYAFSPDGLVYFCNASRSPEACIGRYSPYVEIDFDKIVKLHQRSVLNMKKCMECEFKYVCSGGCPVSSIYHYGDASIPYCGIWKTPEIVELLENALMH